MTSSAKVGSRCQVYCIGIFILKDLRQIPLLWRLNQDTNYSVIISNRGNIIDPYCSPPVSPKMLGEHTRRSLTEYQRR